MSHEKYKWLLVDNFVQAFNDHREFIFFLSDFVCADKIISRWYGQCGHWINMGIPMYIEIDQKPENFCEIEKKSACGRSVVMLWIRVVKTAEERETEHANAGDDGLLHGTQVLMTLVAPWIIFHISN